SLVYRARAFYYGCERRGRSLSTLYDASASVYARFVFFAHFIHDAMPSVTRHWAVPVANSFADNDVCVFDVTVMPVASLHALGIIKVGHQMAVRYFAHAVLRIHNDTLSQRATTSRSETTSSHKFDAKE